MDAEDLDDWGVVDDLAAYHQQLYGDDNLDGLLVDYLRHDCRDENYRRGAGSISPGHVDFLQWERGDVTDASGDSQGDKETKTSQPQPSASTISHGGDVQRLPIGSSVDGLERGSSRVSCMWPDPATGCVYGGHCLMRFFDGQRLHTCAHPPLQSTRAFSDKDANDDRRQQASTLAGRRNKFASFLRWVSRRPQSHKSANCPTKM